MSLIRSPIIPSVPGVLAHQSAIKNGFSTIMAQDFWAPASGGGGGGGDSTFSNLTITGIERFNDYTNTTNNYSLVGQKQAQGFINYDVSGSGLTTFAIKGRYQNAQFSATLSDLTGVPVGIADISGLQTINGAPYVPYQAVISQSINTTFGPTTIPSNTLGTLQNVLLNTTLEPNTSYLVSFPYFIETFSATVGGTQNGIFVLSAGGSDLLYSTIFYPGVPNPNYLNTISGIITTGNTGLNSVQFGINNLTAGQITVGGGAGSANLYFKKL